MTTWTTVAEAERRRETPWSAASSTWATTCHRLPGRYLPSWPTKNTWPVARVDMTLPRSASTERQATADSSTLASVGTKREEQGRHPEPAHPGEELLAVHGQRDRRQRRRRRAGTPSGTPASAPGPARGRPAVGPRRAGRGAPPVPRSPHGPPRAPRPVVYALSRERTMRSASSPIIPMSRPVTRISTVLSARENSARNWSKTSLARPDGQQHERDRQQDPQRVEVHDHPEDLEDVAVGVPDELELRHPGPLGVRDGLVADVVLVGQERDRQRRHAREARAAAAAGRAATRRAGTPAGPS